MFDKPIFVLQEKKANYFNMKILLFMAFLGLFVWLFNEVGVFTQDKDVIRAAIFAQLVPYALVPFFIFLIHDKIVMRKKEITVFEKPFYKYIIMSFSFLCCADICITLSFHAILLLAVPLLMAAQYKNSKKLFAFVVVLSMLMVPIITYGNYIGGIPDRNMLKGIPEEYYNDAEYKFKYLFEINPKRLIEIFTHYALPRMISVALLDYIAIVITKRNVNMINTQFVLNENVIAEKDKNSNMQRAVIEDLADIVESRDIETGEHIKRTKKYVEILCNALKEDERFKDKLNDKTIELIVRAAPLHDIGKITVSDLILLKPGKLTDEEFNQMKLHTTNGGNIIRKILKDLGNEEFLDMAYDIAIAHHEKWNGTGYPNGLKEEEIPLSARIMAIADVFDALVAERCYKKPMPTDKALEIIINDAGTHFDPSIIEVFKTVQDDFVRFSQEKL